MSSNVSAMDQFLTARHETFGIASRAERMVMPCDCELIGYSWSLDVGGGGITADTTLTLTINGVSQANTHVIPTTSVHQDGGRVQMTPRVYLREGDVISFLSDGATSGIHRFYICWQIRPSNHDDFRLGDIALQSHEEQIRLDVAAASLPIAMPFDGEIIRISYNHDLDANLATIITLTRNATTGMALVTVPGTSLGDTPHTAYPLAGPIPFSKGDHIELVSDGGDDQLNNTLHWVLVLRPRQKHPGVADAFIPQAHDNVAATGEASRIVAPFDGELVETIYHLHDILDVDTLITYTKKAVSQPSTLLLNLTSALNGVRFGAPTTQLFVKAGDSISVKGAAGASSCEADVLHVFRPA